MIVNLNFDCSCNILGAGPSSIHALHGNIDIDLSDDPLKHPNKLKAHIQDKHWHPPREEFICKICKQQCENYQAYWNDASTCKTI